MNIAVLVLSLIAAVLMQGFIPAGQAFAGARVPVVSGVVVYYALSRSKFLMFISALLGGILVDGMSGTPFGCSSFCFALAGLFVYYRRDVLFVSGEFSALIFGGITGVFYALGMYLFLLFLRGGMISMSFGEALLKISGTGLLGAFSTPIVFFVISRVDRVVGNVVVVDKNGKS